MLGVLYEIGQGIPRDVVQGHEWFDLSVSGGSVSGGGFARYRCETVTGPRRGWHRSTGTDLSCVLMYQADSRSTGWRDSKGADET